MSRPHKKREVPTESGEGNTSSTSESTASQPARRPLWRVLGWVVRLSLLVGIASGIVLAVLVLAFPYPVKQLDPALGGPLVFVDREGKILRSVPAEQIKRLQCTKDGEKQPQSTAQDTPPTQIRCAGKAPRKARPGRMAWVSLDQLPGAAISTLLASEDASFFSHPGVDAWSILRALYLNIKGGEIGYGASTITMQLMRVVHSAGQRRTLYNKLKEAILALRLERKMNKREILEQYLNRVYYGRGAYGLEAAAQTYFGKPAGSLSIGEATLLSVLPRSPSGYDLFRHRKRALERRRHLFSLLKKRGLLDKETIQRALKQPIKLQHKRLPFRAGHFVNDLLRRLPVAVMRRGGVVHTTLDWSLQKRLEHRVAEHVEQWRQKDVTQAGVVVLDSQTGDILAMVGSADYHAKQGQMNIATWRRYPGSALKPFFYALSIEDGATPSSLTYEIQRWPSRFGTLISSQAEKGPLRYRPALAGSYNISAIQVLERVGLTRAISRLKEAGLGPLDGGPQRYGHQLALGSPKVRLLDLAAAHTIWVRGGKSLKPRWVRHIAFAEKEAWRPQRAAEKQVFSPQASWMIMDILADPEARHQAFGPELPIDDVPFPVALKTGTAQGFSDAVAVGVTREFTVAAWVGRFDGKPVQGAWAMKTAAPLVRTGLLLASRGEKLSLPKRPKEVGVTQVCAFSGKQKTPHCPRSRSEYFDRKKGPPEPCRWHRKEDGRVVTRLPSGLQIWHERHKLRVQRGLR